MKYLKKTRWLMLIASLSLTACGDNAEPHVDAAPTDSAAGSGGDSGSAGASGSDAAGGTESAGGAAGAGGSSGAGGAEESPVLQDGRYNYAYVRGGFDAYDKSHQDLFRFEGDKMVWLGQTVNGAEEMYFETDAANVYDARRFEHIALGRWAREGARISDYGEGARKFLDPVTLLGDVHYVICDQMYNRTPLGAPAGRPEWAGLEYKAAYATTPYAQVPDRQVILDGSTITWRGPNDDQRFSFKLAIKLNSITYNVTGERFDRTSSQHGTITVDNPPWEPGQPTTSLLNGNFRAGFCGDEGEWLYLTGRFDTAPGDAKASFLVIFSKPESPTSP